MFGFLAMTMEEGILAIMQGATSFPGFGGLMMLCIAPRRPWRLQRFGSASGTSELQLNAVAEDHDEPDRLVRADVVGRNPGSCVQEYRLCQYTRG